MKTRSLIPLCALGLVGLAANTARADPPSEQCLETPGCLEPPPAASAPAHARSPAEIVIGTLVLTTGVVSAGSGLLLTAAAGSPSSWFDKATVQSMEAFAVGAELIGLFAMAGGIGLIVHGAERVEDGKPRATWRAEIRAAGAGGSLLVQF